MVAVSALGLGLSVASAAIRGDVVGEYFGALPAVVLPTITGRVVRRLRQDADRLAELTVHLERERERPSSGCCGWSGADSPTRRSRPSW